MNPSTLDVGPEIDVEALVAQVKAIVGARPCGPDPDDHAGGPSLRAALTAQADFNRSLVGLLESVTGELQRLAERVAVLERQSGKGVVGVLNGSANGTNGTH